MPTAGLANRGETIYGLQRIRLGCARVNIDRIQMPSTVVASDPLFQAAPWALLRVDAAGTIAAFNPAAARLFAYEPPAEAVTWRDLCPDTPSPTELSRTPTRTACRRRDGNRFTADIQLVPHADGWYAFVRPLGDDEPDVPLEHSARFIVEHTRSFAVFTLDKLGQIVSWNRGAEAIMGFTEAEAIGRHGDFVFTPEDRAQAIPAKEMTKAAVSGQAEDVRWHLRKDGSRFYANGFMMALNSADGALCGFAKIVRDDTPRKLAEDMVAAQQEQLTATIDSMGEGLVALDTHGLVRLINRIGSALTGWPADEALGRPVEEILRLEHEHERNLAHDVRVLIAEGRGAGAPMFLLSRDGESHLVQITAAAIRHATARIGTVIVLRDIGDYRRLTQALERAQRLESLGQLAGGIAHNFNNVLTALFGNIALAKAYATNDSRVREALAEAERAFHQARDLTQKFLSLSPIAPQRQRESVAPIVNDAIASDALRTRLDGGRIARVRIADALADAVVDRAQIQEALQHVIANAIEATPDDGVVQIEAVNEAVSTARAGLTPGRYVHISVKDNGAGIAPNLLTKVFDPYFSTKQTGSGLGLTIAHAIVQRHGGHIEIHSKLARGSTVHIYLPAAD